MAYEIEFAPAAKRAFKKLANEARAHMAPVIEALATTPRPKAAVKLGDIEGYGCYRVRSGSYRVIYVVLEDTLLILVTQVGHPKEVYRRFEEAARRAIKDRSLRK